MEMKNPPPMMTEKMPTTKPPTRSSAVSGVSSQGASALMHERSITVLHPDGAGGALRRLGSETLAESSLSGKARRNTGVSGWEPGSTSGSLHGVGDLFTALRRQGLIADELVLQLTTFLSSLDLFLELIVLAPRTFTANQVRHGGKQGTDRRELSRIHFSACLALTSLLRSLRPKD